MDPADLVSASPDAQSWEAYDDSQSQLPPKTALHGSLLNSLAYDWDTAAQVGGQTMAPSTAMDQETPASSDWVQDCLERLDAGSSAVPLYFGDEHQDHHWSVAPEQSLQLNETSSEALDTTISDLSQYRWCPPPMRGSSQYYGEAPIYPEWDAAGPSVDQPQSIPQHHAFQHILNGGQHQSMTAQNPQTNETDNVDGTQVIEAGVMPFRYLTMPLNPLAKTSKTHARSHTQTTSSQVCTRQNHSRRSRQKQPVHARGKPPSKYMVRGAIEGALQPLLTNGLLKSNTNTFLTCTDSNLGRFSLSRVGSVDPNTEDPSSKQTTRVSSRYFIRDSFGRSGGSGKYYRDIPRGRWKWDFTLSIDSQTAQSLFEGPLLLGDRLEYSNVELIEKPHGKSNSAYLYDRWVETNNAQNLGHWVVELNEEKSEYPSENVACSCTVYRTDESSRQGIHMAEVIAQTTVTLCV